MVKLLMQNETDINYKELHSKRSLLNITKKFNDKKNLQLFEI